MAITRASGNTWLTANASNTSVSRAFVNNVQAGSLLVAVSAVTANEAITFSDGVNAWSNVINGYHGGLNHYIRMAFAENAAAGATTVNASGATSTARCIAICEYLSAATTSPVDGTAVTNQASASTSNPDPGAVTSTGGAVFIGAGFVYPNAAPTVGTGYTGQIDTTFAGFYEFVLEDQIFTTAQTNNPKYNSNEDYWLMLGAAFKEAAGGGGGGPALVVPVPAAQRNRRSSGRFL